MLINDKSQLKQKLIQGRVKFTHRCKFSLHSLAAMLLWFAAMQRSADVNMLPVE